MSSRRLAPRPAASAAGARAPSPMAREHPSASWLGPKRPHPEDGGGSQAGGRPAGGDHAALNIGQRRPPSRQSSGAGRLRRRKGALWSRLANDDRPTARAATASRRAPDEVRRRERGGHSMSELVMFSQALHRMLQSAGGEHWRADRQQSWAESGDSI